MVNEDMQLILSPVEQLSHLGMKSRIVYQQMQIGGVGMAQLGVELNELKERWNRKRDGNWTDHLEREIAGGRVFAAHCMRIATAFPELASENVPRGTFLPSVLKALAYAPEDVRAEVVERAAGGEEFTRADVERMKAEAKAAKDEAARVKEEVERLQAELPKLVEKGVTERYGSDAAYLERQQKIEAAGEKRVQYLQGVLADLESTAGEAKRQAAELAVARTSLEKALIHVAEILDIDGLEVHNPEAWLDLAMKAERLGAYIREQIAMRPMLRVVSDV